MNDNEMMRRVAAGIQNQSFGKLLGLQVEEAEEGRVVISCQKRDDLLQQTGLLPWRCHRGPVRGGRRVCRPHRPAGGILRHRRGI